MAWRPSWRLAAVVLVALLGISAAAALTGDDPDEEPEPEAASDRFLEAWARSRAATFRSVADFTRTSDSTGAVLTDRVVLTQRPPDWLSIDRDGASGLVDGRRLACRFRREQLVCEDAPAGRSYDDDVARQLDTLEGYVSGRDPLYATTADDDDGSVCFALELQRSIPAPPLGERSTYCFDDEVGAPTRITVERVEADDETVVVALSTEVTDAQLDPETALDPS